MTRSLIFLPSLALIACLQTAVANGNDNAGFLRGDSLRQLARDLRQLVDDSLPDCPGMSEDLYYDANITLETIEEEGAECTEDDMVYIGEEMQKIIKKLERDYPKYSNEFLDTVLCAVPEIEVEDIDDGDDYDYVEEDEDTIDTSPGRDAPTELPELPTNETKPEDDNVREVDGAHITVIKNEDEGLPPWLTGGARKLEKEQLVPTPSIAAVLSEPTMAPSLEPVNRRLATPKPTPRPTVKRKTPAPTPKPTLSKKQKRKARRRKKRYTFKSSGTCRTCKTDDKDRRRRTAETIDEDQAADFAREACNFASTATFADDVAKRGAAHCDKMVEEVEDLAREYKNDSVADKFVDDVEVLLEGCKEQEKKAQNAAKLPSEWCDLATAAAEETDTYSKTQEYRDKAEQSSSDAVAAARRVHTLNQDMMGVKLELKKLILAQNFEIQRKELDNLVEAERSNNALIAQELEEQIELAEEQLRLAEDDETTAQLEKRRDMLEQMRTDKDEQLEKMELELGRMRDTYEAQLEFQIEEANILLQMEGALNDSEWLRGWADLLELKMPKRIQRVHECMVELPDVIVTIIEQSSVATLYKADQCILPWDS